jgi:four helix bundle protein
MSDERKARDYRDPLVWQKGISLAKRIYEITERFPATERFGLISQMRRCAVSIPSSIAEGQGRHTSGEFVQFISQAEGSAGGLDTQLILSEEFKYCGPAEAGQLHDMISEIRRILNSLRRKLIARR